VLQVLEVTEQLLRQSDVLSDFSHQEMPADSLAGAFLSNLGSVLAQQPELGSVIRCAGSWTSLVGSYRFLCSYHSSWWRCAASKLAKGPWGAQSPWHHAPLHAGAQCQLWAGAG
jgi:hypothetical protein